MLPENHVLELCEFGFRYFRASVYLAIREVLDQQSGSTGMMHLLQPLHAPGSESLLRHAYPEKSDPCDVPGHKRMYLPKPISINDVVQTLHAQSVANRLGLASSAAYMERHQQDPEWNAYFRQQLHGELSVVDVHRVVQPRVLAYVIHPEVPAGGPEPREEPVGQLRGIGHLILPPLGHQPLAVHHREPLPEHGEGEGDATYQARVQNE
mmetsp:Transcript_3628/g.9622  ORF Transcript_3628/g.9622 Transcript_3628/m.9622 type:complete len:209 (-) Transcript_3628:130-756(-)